MLSVNVLTQTANKAKFLLNDNAPVILTGAAVVGTVGTAVLTGRASFKAAKIIEKDKEAKLQELSFPDTELKSLSKTETFKMVWPHFVPPVVVGAGTIVCVVMAHKITSKQLAALAVASTVSERALQEYKTKVVEKLGVRQGDAIQDEIAQDKVGKNPPDQQIIITGSGDVLCFEPLTGRYFNSTLETIRAAENKVNWEILHYDSASLSTFFEEIGLLPTDYSDSVGWNVANRLEVKFSTTMTLDNRPCLVIGFVSHPVVDYTTKGLG